MSVCPTNYFTLIEEFVKNKQFPSMFFKHPNFCPPDFRFWNRKFVGNCLIQFVFWTKQNHQLCRSFVIRLIVSFCLCFLFNIFISLNATFWWNFVETWSKLFFGSENCFYDLKFLVFVSVIFDFGEDKNFLPFGVLGDDFLSNISGVGLVYFCIFVWNYVRNIKFSVLFVEKVMTMFDLFHI